MIVTKEISLREFEPWGRAVSTYNELTVEQLDKLESVLDGDRPNGMSETALNNLLAYSSDDVAEMLGFRNWEHLERVNSGEHRPMTVKCSCIDWDTDNEEVEDLPDEYEIEIYDDDDIEDFLDDPYDFLGDKLSDEYDYCVYSFEYEIENKDGK